MCVRVYVCFPIHVDKACHGSSLRVLCRSTLNNHVYSDLGIEVFFPQNV